MRQRHRAGISQPAPQPVSGPLPAAVKKVLLETPCHRHSSFPRETLEADAPAPPPWQTQAHRIQRPEATHQLVPFLRQQGVAVLEFPNDRAQLRNLKLETPSILFIQLLFLKQNQLQITVHRQQTQKPRQVPTHHGNQGTSVSRWPMILIARGTAGCTLGTECRSRHVQSTQM